MNEPVYHFRFRGKTFGPGTLSQLTANPLLTLENAMKIQVQQHEGADWIMLSEVLDFNKPWRALLRANHGYIRLPQFPRTTWEQIKDMVYLHGSAASVEKDALDPDRRITGLFHCRWADSQEEFASTGYGHMLMYPPFPTEHAWRVELRRSESRIWVPLPTFVDLSKGWPVSKPKKEEKPAVPPAPKLQVIPLPSQPSTPPPVLSAPLPPTPTNTGGGGGCLLVIMLIAGVAVTGHALRMDTGAWIDGISGPPMKVHNLSMAQKQNMLLSIGLAMAGVAVISLVIRSGRK